MFSLLRLLFKPEAIGFPAMPPNPPPNLEVGNSQESLEAYQARKRERED